MRDRPNALELLEMAEETLVDSVTPDLSPRQRYNVALITSAFGIARRELNGETSPWPHELLALEELYRDDQSGSIVANIDNLNRQFAADLRSGIYDRHTASHTKAIKILREDTLARLAEDNPRYQK